jgi:hypothetical protein
MASIRDRPPTPPRGERTRKGSIFVSTNAHQIPKLAGRILARYDVHVGIAFVFQAVRQSTGILFDFERANLDGKILLRIAKCIQSPKVFGSRSGGNLRRCWSSRSHIWRKRGGRCRLILARPPGNDCRCKTYVRIRPIPAASGFRIRELFKPDICRFRLAGAIVEPPTALKQRGL